jgi:monoamine oxidase
MQSDVIVIGGGISGLYTALLCVAQGYTVSLLERNQRFGGRIHTIYERGAHYEAGAGRISGEHSRTLQLLQAFHMNLVPISSTRVFRPEHARPRASPVHRLLKRVFASAIQQPREYLQAITFGELCRSILRPQDYQSLVASFGYDAEFDQINAWDGFHMFQRDFTASATYFTCAEGLGEWVQRIVSYLHASDLVKLHLGTSATKWKQTPKGVKVFAQTMEGNRMTFFGKAIVCTMPKKDLLQTFSWSARQRALLESVDTIPLHRIYGKFPVPRSGQSWFHDIPVTSTNNPIRQFIPISSRQGIAMVSYSDTRYADNWRDHASRGERELHKSLLKQLHVVFPEVSKIPSPHWLHSYYWDAGVHMWKPGVNSEEVHAQLLTPFGKHIPWFLVGESYSLHQAWIEGALETVDEVFPNLQTHVRRQQGGTQGFRQYMKARNHKLAAADLPEIRRRFPHVSWVLLRDPVTSDMRMLDVTEWMHMHPGGSYPFTSQMYQDVTPFFQSISAHHQADGKYKKHVLTMLDRYTVATLV